ncbi:hypothetical protein VSS37_08305 [Candidatus Thiothrix sp. Deng01]|uniref:Uncharacterized protein n=1 Tax=Candidatus Thiothrix phosphatis TaxID=3112415 RepID=A0ABU6CW08_9GAMM|nr:hypothetical protein [Candidatus Thiothrix sp. Deng01]MEB4590975.1 hypothetical protein [Candidatus Thiothrix sp. Deng01]
MSVRNEYFKQHLGKLLCSSIVVLGLSGKAAFAGPWPEFTGIAAGIMCTSLPQDSTPNWEVSEGHFLVFDDWKDGKELCYISFNGKPETASVTVTGGDGVVMEGSGFIDIDPTPTYQTAAAETGNGVTPPVNAFSLTSSVLVNGGAFPVEYTCDANKALGWDAAYGSGKFPSLMWDNVPNGTKSFALIMEDLSVPVEWPGHEFVHGIFYNIPAGTRAFKVKN